MNYAELKARISSLPNVSPSFAPYVVEWATNGHPNPTLLSLIPHEDGTVTAARGDLRSKTEPVLDAAGKVVVFPDESAACEWAWADLQVSLSARPQYSEVEQRAAEASGDEQLRRREARLREWEVSKSSGI